MNDDEDSIMVSLRAEVTRLNGDVTRLDHEVHVWKAKAEGLAEYVEHTNKCIRSFWSGGRPTKDGYETCFDGKWYESRPVNKEPACNCGLDEALAVFRGESK